MHFEEKDIVLTDEILKDIVSASKKYFTDGIYVPCNEGHPCGWDFINFDTVDEEDDEEFSILNYKFEIRDISEGIYTCHEYEGLTLKEILTRCENKFEFEPY